MFMYGNDICTLTDSLKDIYIYINQGFLIKLSEALSIRGLDKKG